MPATKSQQAKAVGADQVRPAPLRSKALLPMALAVLLGAATCGAQELRLAVADSTCSAMKEATATFARRTGLQASLTCKSSGMLAKGIQAGILTPDLVVTANRNWMDKIVATGYVDGRSIRKPWGNRLVVVSAAHRSPVHLDSVEGLALPAVRQVIMGDPSLVPLGRYAKNTLQRAKIWAAMRGKVVTRKEISLVLKLLQDEQDGAVAFVYQSSLDHSVRLEFPVPEAVTEPICYYLAPRKTTADHRAVAELLGFLDSAAGRKIFEKAGFVLYR